MGSTGRFIFATSAERIVGVCRARPSSTAAVAVQFEKSSAARFEHALGRASNPLAWHRWPLRGERQRVSFVTVFVYR